MNARYTAELVVELATIRLVTYLPTILTSEYLGCAKNKIFQNKPKGLKVAKEDQIAHMPYG